MDTVDLNRSLGLNDKALKNLVNSSVTNISYDESGNDEIVIISFSNGFLLEIQSNAVTSHEPSFLYVAIQKDE